MSLRHVSTFKPSIPAHTREEWDEINRRVEASRSEERVREAAERLAKADIPTLFSQARTSGCPAAAEAWVRDTLGGRKTPGLILRGMRGSGKTWTASAMLRRLIIGGRTGMFTTTGAMFRDFRSVYSGAESERAVFERYTRPWALVLDDLGKDKPTEWNLSLLFDVLNERYSREKPTIITTQYRGAELAQRLIADAGDTKTAEAIGSRLRTFDLVEFPDVDRRA